MATSWLQELDDVLRGHKADPHLLASGTTHISIGPLAVISVLLGMIYGVCMGLFAMVTRTPPSVMQMIACAIKVPALFFLTLVVTFPSLYVFSALLGVHVVNRTGVAPLLWAWLIVGILPLALIFLVFYIYHVLRERR
jgi:hypothetical protein